MDQTGRLQNSILTLEAPPAIFFPFPIGRFAILAILAGIYFVAGKIGLHFAIINPSAAAIWAPAGIALGACLLYGNWVWPAIFIGAFFVNATTAGSFATSLGIALGNTFEALVGAYLVTRFASGRLVFNRTRDACKFLILAAVLSTTVSATVGVTSLWLGGFARWSDYSWVWLTWWLGDAAGDLLIAPLILLWGTNFRRAWSWGKKAEAVLLLVLTVVGGGVVFGGWLPLGNQQYPLDFLCVPALLWAAFRFGPREAAAVNLLSSAIAVVGTLHGRGPFARGSRNEALLLLQAFAGLTQLMVIAVATEIAAHKRAEKDAERLRDAAEAANHAKDEFLAMLGHELRNPLQAISLAVQLPASGQVNEGTTGKARKIIIRQLGHITRLVDDLLDVSRVTTGEIVLRRKRVNLADCASSCLQVLSETRQFDERHLETAIEPVWVDGDADRLTQILTNLLSNAVKYSAAGAAIQISVRPDGKDAVIRIKDTGIGIRPDLLPQIFDLFARGDVGLARSPGGLGIGLFLVKRIAELHNGSVEALSDGPGRGSTFVVRLPQMAAPVASENHVRNRSIKAAAPCRVLIVEDNADARESLRELLEHRRHEVFEAEDGPSGIEAALRVRPDLALIDIGLPGLDGFEVARQLRSNFADSPITLIAMSGYTQSKHRRSAAAAGFDGYLVKPIDTDELARCMASRFNP